MPPVANPETQVLTEIMLAVFRLGGRLLAQGDQLVAPLDLTSARWQVLGAVALAGQPLSAPQIAEAMGMTRQGAQKQLNTLEASGFFTRMANPRHLRSPLYALTALGEQAYAKAEALQTSWAQRLVTGCALSLAELQATLASLQTLDEQLKLPMPSNGGRS